MLWGKLPAGPIGYVPGGNCPQVMAGRIAGLRAAMRKVTHFHLGVLRLRSRPCVCLCAVALMALCGYAADTHSEKLPVGQLLAPTPHDHYADDVGRFLAGVPAKPDSP